MNDEQDELTRLQAEFAADPSDLDTVFALSQHYLEEGEWDTAVAVYQEAIAAAPDNAALLNDLAVLYDDAGDSEAAEATYRRAIALDPTHGPTYVNLGTLLADQERLDEAIALLEAGIEQAADEEDRDEAAVYLQELTEGSGEEAEDGDEEWQAVIVTSGITVAEMLANRLRAAGIPAHAQQEGAGQAYGLTVGPMGDATVLVPAHRAAEARLLLEEEPPEGVEDFELLEEDPYLTCPNCHAVLELTEEEWEQDSVVCPVCGETIDLVEFE
ncbi:MAG: tetratricopeptide repeat protein [Anaerolineae bacterium]|nr:tetratricopeptide repeat protein [Anaerolineae bacterium]